MFRHTHNKTDRPAEPARREVVLRSLATLALGFLGIGRSIAHTAGRKFVDCNGMNRTRVDLGTIKSGEQLEVVWQGRPVFVRHRTAAEIEAARIVALSDLVDPEEDAKRVQTPEWLVVIGKCTHAGCKPIDKVGQYGGWFCFCHGSQFDTSGRARAGPAARNLEVPPYRFVDKDTLEIGCS